MRSIELTIIIGYLIFCVILGIVAQRRVSKSALGIDEYYAAGRSIGTFVNSLAMLSALGSGGTFLALVGTIWNLGFAYFAWMFAGAIVGFSIASVLVARPLRNAKTLTISEFLKNRYVGSTLLKVIVPLVIIIGSSMYLISQMRAGGLITSYVTGLPFEWGLVIIGFVFILYVSMGGMLAVTWTNVLQGALVLLISLSMFIGGLMHLPVNWSEFFLTASQQNATLGSVGGGTQIAASLGVFLTWGAAVCVTPHLIMRVFTAKNARSATLSMNVSMLLYAAMLLSMSLVIVPFVPTLGQSVLESNAPDMWILLIVEQFFGPILIGVIIAGILAAVMSTTDALLLSVSSAVAYDLYKGVINPQADQNKVLRVSVIGTWVVGILAILLTFNPPPLIIVLYTAAIGFMVSAFFVPVVFGIWWKRANTSGAIAGMLAGAVSFLIAFLALDMPTNSQILVSLPLSLVSMMIVSLMTSKPSTQVIEQMAEYHKA